MAGNQFKKLTRGDEFSVSAAAFNTLMDVAQREYGNAGGSVAAGSQVAGDRTIIRVRNSSGASVGRFAILGIDGVAINATDNLKDFQNVPVLDGVTPAYASHLGKFVITTEPINNGKIGKCVLEGLCAAQISMVESGQKWADILDGDGTQLQSGNAGTAQILWSQSGTGTKWAIVRLGVQLTQVVVVVVSAETGGGKYAGKILAAASGAAGTGDLAASEVGTAPSVADALILNLNEIDTTTHELTEAANTREKYFNGIIRGVADDGRWLVTINGFYTGCEAS
jgi:hypothetical protein